MDTILSGDKRWDMFLGDCIPHMAEVMQPQSVDFSLYSVPFPSMFAYTDDEADVGNVDSINDEVKINFAFFFKALLRVMKPGRVSIVHCMDIPRMKRNGEEGLCDFPGLLLRIAERAGFIWEYRWSIRKNPQAQAIRTKSRELQFVGLESDRAKQRGSLPDYLLKLRAPGENEKAIDAKGQVTRNNWIDWAENNWMDIKETDTLNTKNAKGERDTKHICPLQLGVIDRCIRLFSDPDEIVFSPFAGIGSEGYQALKLDRRFYGCELKPEYYNEALINLATAERSASSKKELSLFA